MISVRSKLEQFDRGLALLRDDFAREVSQNKRRRPKQLASVSAVHPRNFIQAEMSARGWSVAELASRMVGDALRNRALLSHYFRHPTGDLLLGNSIAHRLGVAFGLSADVFLDLEKAWLASRVAAVHAA